MRIILAGKAASGKDYLRDMLVKEGLKPDVSATTRPMRAGEVTGVDYHFITDKQFETARSLGRFYEAVEFNGWQYGTILESWNSSDVFIMTPSGINQISEEDRLNSLVIYLDIPIDVRKTRLMNRSDSDTVDRRIAADEADFKDFTDWDVTFSSEDFGIEAVSEIMVKVLKSQLVGDLFPDMDTQQKIYEYKKKINPAIENSPELDVDDDCLACGS
jgi:guanylate kinase